MRPLALLVTFTLVAGTTIALNEGTTEGGDYPDLCDGYAVAELFEPIDGALAPPEDDADHVGLNITEHHVGTRVNVTYVADTFHTNLEVFTPDCAQNVVPVPHQACAKARCPPGHENDRGKGHEMCMGRGHLSECSGSEGGTSDEDSVSFTPTQAGIYVIRVTVDTRSYHDEGGDCRDAKQCGDEPCRDCVCVNCFDTEGSGDDAGTAGSDDGASIESCHVTCGEDSLGYGIQTFADSETIA